MTAITTEPVYWSLPQKIALRFFLLFFVLFILFNPNGAVPLLDGLFPVYIQPFHKLIPWLASHVLHMVKPITNFYQRQRRYHIRLSHYVSYYHLICSRHIGMVGN